MDLCTTNIIIESFWLDEEIRKNQSQISNVDETEQSVFESIDFLFKKKLREKIFIKIEEDHDNYITSLPGMPIYGYGNTAKKAIKSIKHQLELCYKELNEDDNFSQEWISFKRYLQKIIA